MCNEAILNLIVPGTKQSQREMLQAIRPNDPLLEDPGLDEYESYIMWVFSQLDRDRVYGMSGPLPISLHSISTYKELFNDSLVVDEILLLQRLDITYLNKKHELQELQSR